MASSQTLFGPDGESGRSGSGRGQFSASRSSRSDDSKIRGGFNHFSDVFRYYCCKNLTNVIYIKYNINISGLSDVFN